MVIAPHRSVLHLWLNTSPATCACVLAVRQPKRHEAALHVINNVTGSQNLVLLIIMRVCQGPVKVLVTSGSALREEISISKNPKIIFFFFSGNGGGN